ncbi:MAG: TetR/AcrR family transcriptional regulator [Proteobacteria bacterium]|nr:MAG: TetR/AcrR family transcriptional regulator [Pseudomonadota bacterium]
MILGANSAMGRPKGRTEKAELAENAILEASAFCIGNEGIEAASITRIAERAEVSRALVAHYFPKKEELFEKVIVYIARMGVETIDLSAENLGADPAGKILVIVRENMEFFMKRKHYYRCFILFYHFASIDARLRKINTQFYDRAVERMSGPVLELNPKLTSDTIKLWSEILYRGYFFSIQRYFTVEHNRSAENWRSDAEQEIGLMIKTIRQLKS